MPDLFHSCLALLFRLLVSVLINNLKQSENMNNCHARNLLSCRLKHKYFYLIVLAIYIANIYLHTQHSYLSRDAIPNDERPANFSGG